MTHSILSTERLCSLLVNTQTVRELEIGEWVEVIRIFRSEGLLARFAYQIQDANYFDLIPQYAQKHLSNAIKAAQRQVSSVNYETKEIAKILSSKEQKRFILKGAAYCISNKAVARGRTFSDIDLLVEKQELPKVESMLNLHGWISERLSKYDEAYYREWAHEIPPLKHASRGTVIDLHHNLYPPISGRAPDINLFLDGAKETRGFFILRPAAMTLHSVIHLMLNDDLKHTFRDLNDLHMMFTEFDSEDYWTDLIELAKNAGFSDELFLACRYCHLFFGTLSIARQANSIQKLNKRNKISLSFLDKLFVVALSPKHKLAKQKFSGLFEFAVITRAHLMKMPLHVLVYHTGHKFYRVLVESLLGKSFFDKASH